MKIPASPADLTATWLTDALRAWGGAGEVTVAHFALAPLVESRGFFGELVRLRLTYASNAPGNASSAPRTLIAKFSSPVPEMRRRSVDSYAREVGFYQQLAPHLDLPTPTCYYAAIDPSTGDHILLLEALDARQGRGREAGCTVEEAQLALTEIAKLHIHWWGRTDDPALAWLPDGDIAPDAEAMRRQYDAWWPDFYAQAGTRMPAELVSLSAGLGSHRAAIRQHIFGAAPRTLIHRDYQLDNLLFGDPATNYAGALSLAIVDWQFLSRGHGVWDVAYFLSESLLPEVRRGVESKLLVNYQAILVAGGADKYDYTQFLIDYKVALLQRHSALVSTIAAMPFSEEQRRIHLDILLPRNLAAIVDHEAFALFSNR